MFKRCIVRSFNLHRKKTYPQFNCCTAGTVPSNAYGKLGRGRGDLQRTLENDDWKSHLLLLCIRKNFILLVAYGVLAQNHTLV